MDRRIFIKGMGGGILLLSLQSFKNVSDQFSRQEKAMPALFIGHGSPMNALEENEFTRAWKETADKLPVPRAILCISAHWQTRGTQVTMMEAPRTIHDFSGFPHELFAKQYPAKGAREAAQETIDLIKKTKVHEDFEWGLDHGTWSVLAQMYPDASIPVYQLSLDYTQGPAYHYSLARELNSLRKKGILIIGSGNIVHNLSMMKWNGHPYDWALEFDNLAKDKILKKEHADLIRYDQLGTISKLAIPTNEHYLPMLYSLALQQEKEDLQFFAERTVLSSVSMRSFKIG